MAKNYISKITLPNGITYEIKDVEARDLINQLAVKGISVTVSTTPETTPIGVEWVGDGGTKVIGTLEASAEINSIYLVRSKNASGKDIYDEYIVLKSGEVYVWEKLGDTDISIDDLGDLAYKDSVTGSVEFVDSVTATFTGGVSNVEGKLTPAGNISAEFIGNSLSSTGSYTPEGSVSAELQEDASASVSISYKPSGVVSGSFTGSDMISTGSFTPAGTVTKPNITVSAPKTVGGASKLSTSGSVTRGTLPSFTEGEFTQGSFTQGTDTFVKPVLTTSVTDEVLTISFTQGSFTQGVDNYVKPTKAADTWNAGAVTQVVLPTFNDVDVITNVSAELASAPVFTGQESEVSVSGTTTGSITGLGFTGNSVTLSDNAAVTGTISASFTGSAKGVSVSGSPTGTISASFTGTQATFTASGTSTGTVNVNATKSTKTITSK